MSKKQEKDPLMELLGESSVEISRQKLASFLKPYINFGKDKSMVFRPSFNSLPASQKIEFILSAAKARSLMFEDTSESLSAGELVSLDVMPSGTAKPTIKKLFDGRRIRKDKEGKYFIPPYILDELIMKASEVSENITR